jgi:hypothetical protein
VKGRAKLIKEKEVMPFLEIGNRQRFPCNLCAFSFLCFFSVVAMALVNCYGTGGCAFSMQMRL